MLQEKVGQFRKGLEQQLSKSEFSAKSLRKEVAQLKEELNQKNEQIDQLTQRLQKDLEK